MLALPRLSRDADEIVAHDRAPGFRMLRTDALSARLDPLIGLESGPDSAPPAVIPADLCAALFRDGRSERRQVAYFTDIHCPHCRQMERWLRTLPEDGPEITTHDLPLLGASSLAAARAIGAAGLMGAEGQMRARLHRARVQADPAYLAGIARGLGLDAGRLLAGLDDPRVTARLSESLGAAAALAIPGTPALVIGDVAVIGRIDRAQFERLLASYRPAPCRGTA